jgi:response regulator RpfG family c-di-GMP phosphodiesterase
LRAQYLEIKSNDLRADSVIPFEVFHLLPLRQKFLPFIFNGDTLDAKKQAKIQDIGEIYVHRKDAGAYKTYVAAAIDMSAQGLSKRCRAQFLALYVSYSSLVFLLTDQSETASFKEGGALLKNCRDLCDELLGTLAEFGNAWDIINNSTIGEFGSVERAPAIAAYAALFSLQLGMDKVSDTMLAALLSDLGLLFLPSPILIKIRNDQIAQLTPEERALYQKYPTQSLAVILDRKIALDDKLRTIVVSIKERGDGKGFPKGTQGHKVPIEAQMIQFSWDFDRRTLLRLGKQRPDPLKERNKLIEEELASRTKYTEPFMAKLQELLTS